MDQSSWARNKNKGIMKPAKGIMGNYDISEEKNDPEDIKKFSGTYFHKQQIIQAMDHFSSKAKPGHLRATYTILGARGYSFTSKDTNKLITGVTLNVTNSNIYEGTMERGIKIESYTVPTDKPARFIEKLGSLPEMFVLEFEIGINQKIKLINLYDHNEAAKEGGYNE